MATKSSQTSTRQQNILWITLDWSTVILPNSFACFLGHFICRRTLEKDPFGFCKASKEPILSLSHSLMNWAFLIVQRWGYRCHRWCLRWHAEHQWARGQAETRRGLLQRDCCRVLSRMITESVSTIVQPSPGAMCFQTSLSENSASFHYRYCLQNPSQMTIFINFRKCLHCFY